jgi:hypothetical protein
MQNLLLLTGDKEIKWNNPHNLYLGSGTKENPGLNYVGKTMMDIREKIKRNRKNNQLDIKHSDLVEFVQKDSFIMEWIKMKLTDMCSIINKTQNYLKIKTDLDYNLQEGKEFKKLIKSILVLKRKDISSNILQEYLGQFWIHLTLAKRNR